MGDEGVLIPILLPIARDPPCRDVETGTWGEHLHVLEAIGDEENDVGIEKETNRIIVVDDLMELLIKGCLLYTSRCV